MPKIHSIRQNDVKMSNPRSFQAERSHLGQVNSLSKHVEIPPEPLCRPPLVKQFYSGKLKMWLPMSLHPSQIPESDSLEPPEVNEVSRLTSDLTSLSQYLVSFFFVTAEVK